MSSVCSQEDVLWDDLNGREHMFLTAAFKGLRWGPQLFAAVDAVLGLVQLSDRADEFTAQYSGGMKRRLSVAMSTVGDVEILFLDEPSTGLGNVTMNPAQHSTAQSYLLCFALLD